MLRNPKGAHIVGDDKRWKVKIFFLFPFFFLFLFEARNERRLKVKEEVEEGRKETKLKKLEGWKEIIVGWKVHCCIQVESHISGFLFKGDIPFPISLSINEIF